MAPVPETLELAEEEAGSHSFHAADVVGYGAVTELMVVLLFLTDEEVELDLVVSISTV